MILTRDGKEITAVYRQDGSEVDEVKDAAGRLIYTASREITGTLPLSFSSRGKPLTDYMIYGNTIQNGTPTPEAPVDVVGCGVRTGNLFSGEFSQFDDVGGTGNIYGYFYIPEDFILTLIAKDTHTIPDNIFLGITKDGGQSTGGFTWAIPQRKNVIEGNTFTVKSSTSGYHYVSMYQKTATVLSWILKHYYVILNLGSTALPYEPYGFKLPLTVNGTEYPIYLGTVPTTRRIKKLVLTGEEGWTITSNGVLRIGISGQLRLSTPLCTHYLGSNSNAWSDVPDKSVTVSISGYLAILDTAYTTAANFRSYLAAQYAAGTPVTVWYVLAEPETAIANEPLMKIGIYADTITMAQAGVTIPTIRGTNVLDMTTPVNPSEVYIKGKGIKAIT